MASDLLVFSHFTVTHLKYVIEKGGKKRPRVLDMETYVCIVASVSVGNGHRYITVLTCGQWGPEAKKQNLQS